MIFWKRDCLICTAVALLCSLASVQGYSKAESAASFASLPNIDIQETNRELSSLAISKRGDVCVQHLAWKEAKQDYLQALDLWSDNTSALYGLAESCHASGDTEGEVKYYRKAIFSSNPAGNGFRENDPKKLMEFVILLSKSGQVEQVLSVYQHGATALNQTGRKVPLPTFGSGPGQLSYTPERLQAMAHVALSIVSSDPRDALPQVQEAIRLYPTSAVAYFYLGNYYARSGDRQVMRQARTAYRQAIKLDSGSVGAMAKEQIKLLSYFIGF